MPDASRHTGLSQSGIRHDPTGTPPHMTDRKPVDGPGHATRLCNSARTNEPRHRASDAHIRGLEDSWGAPETWTSTPLGNIMLLAVLRSPGRAPGLLLYALPLRGLFCGRRVTRDVNSYRQVKAPGGRSHLPGRYDPLDTSSATRPISPVPRVLQTISAGRPYPAPSPSHVWEEEPRALIPERLIA